MPDEKALLAPIPDRHVKSGKEVCDREGKVAFGSDLWPFPGIEPGTRVLIYASHDPEQGPDEFVSWEAIYVDHVDATPGGKYPRDPRFRPPSTVTDTTFSGFYEVRDLRPLDPPIGVSDLARKDGSVRKNWPPRRPQLIPAP